MKSYGISLLGIHQKKSKILHQKDICTLMFLSALFIMVKIWKPLKYPQINRWVNRMWSISVSVSIYIYVHTFVYIWAYTHLSTHMHNGLLLGHQKNEILLFVTTWMDVEDTLSEISQTKTDTLWFHIFLKFWYFVTNVLNYKWRIKMQPEEKFTSFYARMQL